MEPVSGVAAVFVAVHSTVRYLCDATTSFRNVALELRSIDLQCCHISTVLSQIEGIVLEYTEKDCQRQDSLMKDLYGTLCGCQHMFEEQLRKLEGYDICGNLNMPDTKKRKKIKAILNRTELNFHHQRLEEQFRLLHSMLEMLRTSREHAHYRAWNSSRVFSEKAQDASFESRTDSCSQLRAANQQRPTSGGIRNRMKRMCSSRSIGQSAAFQATVGAATPFDPTPGQRPPSPVTKLNVPHPPHPVPNKSTFPCDECKSQSAVQVTAIRNPQHEAQNEISRRAHVRSSKSTPAMRERVNLAPSEISMAPAIPQLPAQHVENARTLIFPHPVRGEPGVPPNLKEAKDKRLPLSERDTNTQPQRSGGCDDREKANATTRLPGHRKAASVSHSETMVPELAHLKQSKHSSVDASRLRAHHYVQDHGTEKEHLTITLTRVRSEMLLRKGSCLFESGNIRDSNGLKSPLQRLESFGKSAGEMDVL